MCNVKAVLTIFSCFVFFPCLSSWWSNCFQESASKALESLSSHFGTRVVLQNDLLSAVFLKCLFSGLPLGVGNLPDLSVPFVT